MAVSCGMLGTDCKRQGVPLSYGQIETEVFHGPSSGKLFETLSSIDKVVYYRRYLKCCPQNK